MAEAPNNTVVPEHAALLKAKHVAAMLQVGVRTVQEWTKKGLIPHIRLPGQKIIRYDEAHTRRWIADGCPRPGASYFQTRRRRKISS